MPRHQSPLSLEYILLGLLDQNPVHGYDLYKNILHLEGISLVWHIKQSQLYALLDKLEVGGLLNSRLLPGEAHPARKEYRITETGKEVFFAWRASPVSHGREMRQEFLAKLYFAQQAGRKVGLDLIEGQKQTCQGWLADLQAGYSSQADGQLYARMVLRYRLSQTKAMLEWLDFCRDEIQAQPEINRSSES
jgi:PadR family transcriptional regulator AphA